MKVPDIRQTFDHIRFLSYPKDKTSLKIYYRDNEYVYHLTNFEKNYSNEFKNFEIINHEMGKIDSRKRFSN
jgi:hypothetical protein